MAYDPVRKRTLMFSGSQGKDLWAYDAKTNSWTRLADAPVGAPFVSLAYDSKYDVFMASLNEPDNNSVPNRFLVYKPATDSWTELFAPPGDTWPSITRKATMVYDVANDVFVHQGGLTDSPKWYVFRYDPGTPAAATLSVTSPNGGETWTAGSSASVTWATTGTVGNVKIDLSTDGGANWTTLLASTPNDGGETVTVPNSAGTTCRIRVQDTGGTPSDVSDGNFTIAAAPPPPLSGDTDGDGLPDTWETQYFGNLAQGAGGDPDGDGSTNLQEYQAGTDPTTAPPAPPPPSGGSGGGGTVPVGDDEGKEGCGATGMEVVLLLVPLLWRKKRR